MTMNSVLLLLTFHGLLATEACTEIRVTAKDNSVIIGRTMEYMANLFSQIVVEPKGYSRTAVLPDQCLDYPDPLQWQNNFTIAYINLWDLDVGGDGMNTAGLSVGALMFPRFTKYQDVPTDKCGQAVSSLEFTQWLLGNFATVKEVKDMLETDSFPLVFGQKLLDHTFELHYSVMDKSGEGIVIEFTEEGRQVHPNTLGVMTNAPPYDFHMLNIRNYIQLSNYNHEPLVLGTDVFPATGEGSGLLGMPGDLTPPSRLIRAAILKEFATQPKTSEEAVNLAYHVLNSVDIPHGVLSDHQHERFADYTSWAVAKDLANNAFYFRDYNDLTIRVVYLNNVQQDTKLKINIFGPIGGFNDVTDQMEPTKQPRSEL